jgi:hypothetical protein
LKINTTVRPCLGGQPVEWVEKFLKMGGLTLLFDALARKQKSLYAPTTTITTTTTSFSLRLSFFGKHLVFMFVVVVVRSSPSGKQQTTAKEERTPSSSTNAPGPSRLS